MIIENRDLKIIIPFLVLLVIGLYGMYSVDYISVNLTFEFVKKYLLIPLFLFSLFYAYCGTFRSDKKAALWKNILVFIILAMSIGMVTFVALQGLSMIVNKEFGTQHKYNLSGEIIKLNYPENKKIGNKYSIYIKRDVENDTIELNVPTNKYRVGQKINKEMKIGSLKFIYSDK
ncbi:hypothetical protein [Flavobacterium sp. ov086]|uniref:hypothetical protein n=1 Tax=Flavobacterium sp. ov086 TaxID=1761785 RepID=UPI000B66467C|nr:hypothetical protein [Flavobacterium sp. ov086]SNR53444.1 hypothetical protein SAMN04487979_11052 [Flavobacterium sp. ov086]